MLHCLNCKAAVPQDEAKIFAEVFCCANCFSLAERTYGRLQEELRKLLLVSKESIRIALLEGKLHLGEASNKELSKEEVLREIVRLEELRQARTQ